MAEVIFPTKNYLIKPISIASEDDIDDRILSAHGKCFNLIDSVYIEWGMEALSWRRGLHPPIPSYN